MRTAKGFTYANLFVILIGRPGIGKSEAINNIRPIVKATGVKDVFKPATELLPYDVTKGAMLDRLAQYKRFGPDPYAETLDKAEKVVYHSAFLAVSELGNLVREKDNALLNSLHDLYDCLAVVEEERRYLKNTPIAIVNPSIALLGGTTPSYLSETFPPQAWNQGFMARVIMIYSADMIEPDLFNEQEIDIALASELVQDLRQVGRLQGKMVFTEDAKKAIVAWQKSGRQPQPEHQRLEHYNTRRMRHALKLSMVAAIDVPAVERFWLEPTTTGSENATVCSYPTGVPSSSVLPEIVYVPPATVCFHPSVYESWSITLSNRPDPDCMYVPPNRIV